MSRNRLFASGVDPSLNACVGDNTGGSGDYGYVLGFAQAALVLIAAAKRQTYPDPDTGQEAVAYQDALIYPICFTARHHIELFLKRQVPRVAELRRSRFNARLLDDHALGPLMDELRRLCQVTDRRLPPLLDPFEAAITAFADLDPTGQTFRYRTSMEDTLHLEHLPHINLELLERGLKPLFQGTEKFEENVHHLSYEYDQRSFTSKLCRPELRELAQALPARRLWAEGDGFDKVKADYQERYQLSGKAFSEAIETIERHREFASLVGVQLPMPDVDPVKLRRFAALDFDPRSFDSTTPREWRALAAIWEVGHLDTYSEHFDFTMNVPDNQAEDRVLPPDVIRQLASNGKRFRRGLVKLGQSTLLEHFDAGVSQRSQKDGNALVEKFIEKVRVHFFATAPTRRKYEGPPSSPAIDPA